MIEEGLWRRSSWKHLGYLYEEFQHRRRGIFRLLFIAKTDRLLPPFLGNIRQHRG